MRIVFQIGYKKSTNRKREGQKVSVFINDVEMGFEKNSGKYLTSYVETHRTGSAWFLREEDVSLEDVIRIDVKTVIAGLGIDEKRSFEAMYYVDESAPVREIYHPGVGYNGYPLMKGRLLEIMSFSEDDKRKEEIDIFLDEEGF